MILSVKTFLQYQTHPPNRAKTF